jgi:Protein of unknown function (DUF2868)
MAFVSGILATMPAKTPSLSDLYQLSAQLELDRDLSVQALRERDHSIGVEFDAAGDGAASDDCARLLYWLQQVSSSGEDVQTKGAPWLTETSAAYLARIIVGVMGFISMTTFLLTSGRGLVNVFMFMLLFVIVQLGLCVVAAAVMTRTLAGSQPLMLPLNPARFIVSRQLPDQRYLREAGSLVRLVLLRYGQELGALFTLGAVAAFFIVLGLSDFTFVWGSTFSLSDSLVLQMSELIATPWSALLPQATVDARIIADSRFHPAVTDLGMANIDSMRGWWPFLIMAMFCYALLPRLLLWAVSRYFYGSRMRAALTGLPGSALVLARMRSPLVKTQGEANGPRTLGTGKPDVVTDPRLLLLNWSNALNPGDAGQFEPLFTVADGNIVNVGLGAQSRELANLAAKLKPPVEELYVAVKSWEPPMADLADFLSNLGTIRRCTVLLVPLPGRAITVARLEDWRQFTRALDFDLVDVMPLERV